MWPAQTSRAQSSPREQLLQEEIPDCLRIHELSTRDTAICNIKFTLDSSCTVVQDIRVLFVVLFQVRLHVFSPRSNALLMEFLFDTSLWLQGQGTGCSETGGHGRFRTGFRRQGSCRVETSSGDILQKWSSGTNQTYFCDTCDRKVPERNYYPLE